MKTARLCQNGSKTDMQETSDPKRVDNETGSVSSRLRNFAIILHPLSPLYLPLQFPSPLSKVVRRQATPMSSFHFSHLSPQVVCPPVKNIWYFRAGAVDTLAAT